MDIMSAAKAKLWGVRRPGETQRAMLIHLAERSGVRMFIVNSAGTSLASIELDNSQVQILGSWLTQRAKATEDPCFGIHNFMSDPGGDPVEGPAHCTECGCERVDPS